MRSFRRFVIGLAEVIQIISMIAFTLLCGVVGGAYGTMLGLDFGNLQFANQGATSTGALLGFGAGALVGFTTSATVAAFLFVLAEIAMNTRDTNRLLRLQANLPEQYPVRAQVPQPQLRTEPRL